MHIQYLLNDFKAYKLLVYYFSPWILDFHVAKFPRHTWPGLCENDLIHRQSKNQQKKKKNSCLTLSIHKLSDSMLSWRMRFMLDLFIFIGRYGVIYVLSQSQI
jgi:hypothetical protein